MKPHRHLSRLPWTAVRAFEAAARLKSFKHAADELHVTPTAISHQIRNLETHLGVVLFERRHRSLALTPAGERLAEASAVAFGALETTLDDLVRRGAACGPGTLTISAVTSFALKWLAPRLPAFQATRSDIELRLVASDVLVDFRTDASVDIAVRYGPGPYDESLHAEPLWPRGTVVPVCAPQLAAGADLADPATLARQTLLRTVPPASWRSDGRGDADWLAWLAAAGATNAANERATRTGPLFSNSQLAIEAAIAGHGIALVPAMLVQSDLAGGRLVQAHPLALDDANRYWLLYRKSAADAARIHAFAQWLRSAAAQAVAATG